MAGEDLDTAMRRLRHLAYAILEGTLIPIDRVADKPYYSGKHRRHGMKAPAAACAPVQSLNNTAQDSLRTLARRFPIFNAHSRVKGSLNRALSSHT